ncbi:hypothetical protein GQ44DRAFT_704836 [Phaeosphaeriaceae sp. PMI808]|nr:hypothetical protein GQ44DRAFT_704836 [Phaeosphaeriaceae sp. PMI808]
MYCAPEVFEHEKRNRSADIFSLGCVFTELAIWIARYKETDYDINQWHRYREVTIDDITTNSYHVSVDKITQWFLRLDSHMFQKLYQKVISKMLCKSPGDRLTAIQVSINLSQCLKSGIEKSILKPCSACRLDLWVNIPFVIASELSASLNSSTLTYMG